MSIEEVIKKAVGAGYDGRWNSAYQSLVRVDSEGNGTPLKREQVFLDPSFWRSLGKGLGWGKTKDEGALIENSLLNLWPEEWQVYWHIFIGHLAEGGSAESFFENLK